MSLRIRPHLAVFCLLLLATASLAQGFGPAATRVYPAAGALNISIHDSIDSPIYSWPRTLLTYPVGFSLRSCTARQLHLLDDAGQELPFQLSAIATAPDGHLLSAQLNLFADLPPGATRTFHLVVGLAGKDQVQAPAYPPGVIEKRVNNTIEVTSAMLSLRLPASQSAPEATPLPAPILAISRDLGPQQHWIGHNTITLDHATTSPHAETRITTRLLESGDLFRTYEVAYLFSNGASYTATLRIVAGYPFVLFSERMEDLTPEMGIALNMDWDGFSPTRRFAANGWMQPHGELGPGGLGIDEPVTTPGIIEEPHWFPADRVEDPHQEMIFHLAAFEGNAPREAVPAMSFWEPTGSELGVFVPDTATWDDRQYSIWQPTTLLQVSFRYTNGHLIWHWPLVSGTRETGIAFTPSSQGEQTMQQMRDTYAAAGKDYPHAFNDNGAFSPSSLHARYAQWLRSWYGSLDLNRVKDWVLTYPSSARQSPPPLSPAAPNKLPLAAQASQFESKVLHSMLMDYPLGSNLGIMNISHRTVRPIVEQYMQLRTALTSQQKSRIDALLLLSAYINAGEDLAPSRVCLSGTPNMSADGFSVPTEIGVLFPDHPMNPEWRDQFEKIIQLDATFYTRPDVPAYHSLGGRWTESLAVYNWAYLVPVLTSQLAITHTDGSNRIANDAMAQRARWMADELSAPVYNLNPYWRQNQNIAQPPASPWKPGIQLTPANGFERQYPSHGAHGTGTGIVVRYDAPVLAKYLLNYDPLAAEHLLWAYAQRISTEEGEPNDMYWRNPVLDELKHNTGTNPHLRSSKYTGHGIILRGGVDTPDEVSIHLDQTDQGPNYRWGDNGEGSSGVLYFFANGQSWTGHERENTGDHSNDDATGTTTFAVLHDHTWRSIGENVLDHPLYDLGSVQFGEIAARTGLVPYSWPAYRSRSVMLVGTDYAILGDDADGETRFSWFTARDLPYPKIAFLQPLTARPDHWTEVGTETSKGFIRDANGPSIVLFTHKKDSVELEHMTATPIRALHDAEVMQYGWEKHEAPATEGIFFVKTATSHDRIFRSFTPIHYADHDEAFDGNAGVIRTRNDGVTELDLIHGTLIEAKSIRMEIPEAASQSTAISATIAPHGEISGVFCNLGSSPVTLTLTANIADASIFYIDGSPIAPSREDSARRIELPPGRHTWQLSAHLPTPLAPSIERTVNHSGGAQVYFNTASGATGYRLETSTDGGTHWQPGPVGPQGPLTINGLANNTKVHLRIIARNAERDSPPSGEYPLYVSANAPPTPDGLALELGEGTVRLHWGQVLGAEGYHLYRRREGDTSWQAPICSGPTTSYYDITADGVIPSAPRPGIEANLNSTRPDGTRYEYAIAAFNDNGESPLSPLANTDSTSWRNWWPAGQSHTFKRQTGFWLPPYVPATATPPLHYPSN